MVGWRPKPVRRVGLVPHLPGPQHPPLRGGGRPSFKSSLGHISILVGPSASRIEILEEDCSVGWEGVGARERCSEKVSLLP